MSETSTDTTGTVCVPAAPTEKAHFWNSPAVRRAALAVLAAVPVALVNGTAFIGQFEFLHSHVPWILPGQILFAVALESVAVYLAWHAHIARMSNDSSGRITLSAYLFALVIASMNYSHYAGPHWRPTFMAVGLALMSASSPWLWNVHSRRVSRDKLMERGLLEEKAVRLGATRWTWHPVRSVLVTWLATWEGETNPKRAIEMLAQRQADRAARRAPAGADRNDGTPGTPTAPLPAPAQQAAVPARQPLVGLTGGAATSSGAAALTAGATVTGGKRPEWSVIQEAVEKLDALPVDQLPAARFIAREWFGDPNQRRLADQLLKARKETGQLAPQAGDQRQSRRGTQTTTMIANPAAFAPGGITSVNA